MYDETNMSYKYILQINKIVLEKYSSLLRVIIYLFNSNTEE